MNRGSSLRFIATPTACLAEVWVLIVLSSCARSTTGGDRLPHVLSRLLHRLDDVLVAGAAAQIAGQPFTDVCLAWIRVVLEEHVRRQDHPRRAEAALEPVLIPEGLLE